jgi:hypothetical protein
MFVTQRFFAAWKKAKKLVTNFVSNDRIYQERTAVMLDFFGCLLYNDFVCIKMFHSAF